MLLQRGDVRLAGVDFGGEGPAALLPHGLAGYAGEWGDGAVADRALPNRRPRRARAWRKRAAPADVSRAAHVGDGAFAIGSLGLAPAIVVGQSLGGQAALLLASEHPDLVRALVLADAARALPRRKARSRPTSRT
jgi:pimeloyl-ACP methyl ester carboxylesterase